MAGSAADILWAKLNPYKSLSHHMIDSGACAEALMRISFCSASREIAKALNTDADSAVALVAYITALHDIGKSHPLFQRRCADTDAAEYDRMLAAFPLDGMEETPGRLFRHERYSEDVVQRIWSAQGVDECAIESIGAVIARHHQGKNGSARAIISVMAPPYIAAQNDLEQRMRSLFMRRNTLSVLNRCTDWSCVCMLAQGIMIASDWIASGAWFESLADDLQGAGCDDAYYEKAHAAAINAVCAIGIAAAPLPHITAMSDMFPYITEPTMRPMQRTISKMSDVPRLAVIEDVPGAGKTEAAVYLASRMQRAYHKSGLYFALPTAATSNQMYERMNCVFKTLNQPGCRLLHGTAWAVDQSDSSGIKDENTSSGTETIGSDWLAPSRKALLSQNAVGTVDQVMMAVLRAKYSELRMLGLSDKVLIVDEVHAYDAYMSDIIERLLEWCGDLEIPVILLSATLPSSRKTAFINAYRTGMKCAEKNCPDMMQAYPMLTAMYSDGRIEQTPVYGAQDKLVSYNIACGVTDMNVIADHALNAVKDGGNLCVMANTVTDANAMYDAIRSKAPADVKLALYHARFTVGARAKIEQSCVSTYGKHGNRPKKSILVCTQVVEQSLDVDFDAMITFIAPIDLLIQRMGRIHRHSENIRPSAMSKPTMTILVPSDSELKNEHKLPGTHYVYAPCVLNATIEYLSKKPTHVLSMLHSTREAVEAVYSHANDALDRTWAEKLFSDAQHEALAHGCEIGAPDPDDYWVLDDAYSAQVFGDDADGVSAATRLGGNSVRVVLADETLYAEYMQMRAAGHISANVYTQMLIRSVSIPLRADEAPDADLIEQSGRLCGYAICKCADSTQDSYRLSDSIMLVRDEPDIGGTGVHIVRIPVRT